MSPLSNDYALYLFQHGWGRTGDIAGALLMLVFVVGYGVWQLKRIADALDKIGGKP
jgi:hypothetical protein